MTSALQSWTLALTIQQQTDLISAIRGPDGFPKDHRCKQMVYRLRACVLNNASTGEPCGWGEVLDSFMSMDFRDQGWDNAMGLWARIEDELPLHYYTHFMHAAEVLAYNHPVAAVKVRWFEFYHHCCRYLHVKPEFAEENRRRLSDFGRLENV